MEGGTHPPHCGGEGGTHSPCCGVEGGTHPPHCGVEGGTFALDFVGNLLVTEEIRFLFALEEDGGDDEVDGN